MRLKSAIVEGFRGLASKVYFDLDADVILVHGPNGVGKTSLFDAVLWALTGRIDRFGKESRPISLYAREGIARVVLSFKCNDDDFIVTRATDGNKDSVRLQTSGAELDGAVAESKLAEYLLPHLRDRQTGPNALSRVLTRGVYLQQDLVRQFVEADSDAERFGLVSEIIGAGVVLELQEVLEKSRNQWSRNISSKRNSELDPLVQQLARINEQRRRLEGSLPINATDARSLVSTFFAQAATVIGRGLSVDEPREPSGLDRLLKEIGAERSRIEREITVIRALLDEARTLSISSQPESISIAGLQEREQELTKRIAACDAAVEKRLGEIAQRQQKEMEDQNRANRLATMAQLAMNELGESCPVCQQQHNINATTLYLRSLIAASNIAILKSDPDEPAIKDMNAQRSHLRQEQEAVRTRILDMARSLREAEARRLGYLGRLKEIGIPASFDTIAELEVRLSKAENRLAQAIGLLRQGEELGVTIVRLSELHRRTDLRLEADALEPKIKEATREIEQLEKTHSLAGQIIEGLRRASLEVTRQQVKAIQPLFQRIYSRIEPHPTFRLVQLITEMERGKGLLRTGVLDPDQSTAQMHDARPILSSSQLNSFAVSLFLALNFGLSSMKLKLTMLDDPLQSLDSINLLGLVDVLRRFREHRQIIVSTHEPRLLGLLQRKLRPVRVGERMVTVSFDSWSKTGPEFRTFPVTYDFTPQRVLAA